MTSTRSVSSYSVAICGVCLLSGMFLGAAPESEVGAILGVVVSPTNGFYLVQTVKDWTRSETGIVTKGRVQVFQSGTGSLVWQKDGTCGQVNNLWLSDNGETVLYVNGCVKVLSTNATATAATTVLRVFRKGELLWQYSLSDCGFGVDDRTSVDSYIEVFPYAWSCPAFDYEHHKSMSEAVSGVGGVVDGVMVGPEIKGDELSIYMRDGFIRTINLRTGKIGKKAITGMLKTSKEQSP